MGLTYDQPHQDVASENATNHVHHQERPAEAVWSPLDEMPPKSSHGPQVPPNDSSQVPLNDSSQVPLNDSSQVPPNDSSQPPRFLSPLFTGAQSSSDPADIRIDNRMAIFNLLFPDTALSRAEISRRIQLSRVSVSQTVAEMTAQHLLVESGHERSSHPGKRGLLVRLDQRHLRIIVIDLSSSYVLRGAVMDIAGHIVSRMEKTVPDPQLITVNMVTAICTQLGKRVKAPEETILGIGVAVPGIIDSAGTVIESSHLGWSHLPLQKMLREHFHCPCFVDNDSNSAVLAVRLFDDHSPNMIFVQLTKGVGSAVLLNDSIVLGAEHAAGEIGHVILDPSGPQCACGKRGCLETFIAPDRLRARIAEGEGVLQEAAASLADAPTNKDEILREAGARLGQVLACSANLLNIENITVFGPPDIVNDSFTDGATATINEYASSQLLSSHITVRRCEIGDDITLLGESIAVLQRILERR